MIPPLSLACRSSDDEGVFDLDLDIEEEPDSTDMASVGLQFVALTRARAYPTRRASGHSKSASEPPKEKLVNLTQAKIRSFDSVRNPDGLRNKVLLEAALKRYLTVASPKKQVSSFTLHQQQIHRPSTSSHNNLRSPVPKTDLNHLSLKSSLLASPRKRSSKECDGSQGDNNGVTFKRLKSFHFEDMDVSDLCINGPSSPRRDEQFADLANEFFRLKTQQ